MPYSYSNAERAKILVQALPYIQKHSGKIVVIKYGGNAMINDELKQQVMEDIVLLWHVGVKIVLVHGGGPEINDLMKRLGKKAEFVDGLRVTDKETVDIVEMILAGKVNKSLVNLLQMRGGNAIGLSGIDGRLIECKVKDSRLGFVGEVTHVNAKPVLDLLDRRLRRKGKRLQHQRRYGGGLHCRRTEYGNFYPDDGCAGNFAGQG